MSNLLILVVIIIAMILGVFFVKRYVPKKITHWLLFIYIGVLLLSMIATSVITKTSMSLEHEKLLKNEVKLKQNQFFESLNNGDIEELMASNLLKLSSFEYHEPALEILTSGIGSTRIYIERKDVDDATIEAYAFHSGIYIHGINFNGKISTPQYGLYKDKFEINIPVIDINASIIKNEFAATQFLGEWTIMETPERGQLVVYLKIPTNLEVFTETDMQLDYIK